MKKLSSLLILTLLLLADYSYAQTGTEPIPWTAPIKVNSDNIFLLWSQLSGDSIRSYQQVYKYLYKPSMVSKIISTTPPSDTTVTFGNGQMDVAAGYFRSSVFEDVVAAWETYNAKIHIMIPHIDSTSHTWSSSSEITIPGPAVGYYNLNSSSTSSRGRIYVRTGDFLGNGLDQFVLAYEGADSLIHINLFSVDNNLNPHLLATAQADTFDVNPPWAKFSMAAGDLNGDGKDEIVLNGLRVINNGSRVSLYTKIYELNGSSLEPEGSLVSSQWNTGTGNVSEANCSASVGNFYGGGNAIGLTLATFYAGTTENFNTYFITASSDLKTLTYLTTTPIRTSLSSSRNGALSVSSGDLNGNGRDELVFADLGNLYDCGIDSTGKAFVNHLSTFYNENYDDIVTYDYLGVGDLDEDGSDDIVLTKGIWVNGEENFNLYGRSVKKDLSKDSLMFHIVFAPVTENSIKSLFHYALVLGTFDGGSFKIGAPTFYKVNSVVKPVVVLNTPPIHFDILNGTKYDLSNCFSGNGCTFYSTYEQQSSTSVNLETQTHNDVSDAAGVDLSGSAGVTFGVGVQYSVSANFELKVEGTWGHSFASNTSTMQTTSLQIGVSAMGDDQIYATTSSYNLWVYPVYQGNDPEPVNFLNFASPTKTQGAWFPSKSYAINNYIPNHEVGNVLSYLPSENAMNNPNIDSSIVSVSQSQGLPISGQSGSYWDLNYTKYLQSSLDSTWNSGWDVNIQAVGAYSSTGDNVQMTTNTTSIMNGWDLRATFGSLIDSLGSAAGYTVYPYAYRSKQGAIVLTYAVDPDIAPPGQPPTWWQQEYGHYSNPTFILPWFYAAQEGTPVDTVKKYETSDIYFSKNNPQPGDTITITARVRNFSLVPTTSPVAIKFYVGNPESGGTIITGINGSDSAMTAALVKDRSWSDATIKWAVPSGLPQFPRIYAVIDPSNQIQKMQENNNMGWAVLGQQSQTNVSGIVQNKPSIIPNSPVLYQSYPNPFNPTAHIDYSIPKTTLVKLTVYNILGQKVKTLFYGEESPGKYSVNFNGDELASGVYFYRLRAGNFISVKKMLLLK